MKKFIALTLAGIMLLTSPMSVLADGIVYNGEQMTYTDQQPVIIDSRTYVPIRDVFEKLGFKVEWDADTKIVSITNDYYSIMLTTVTSKLFVVDLTFVPKASRLENTVQIVNGRTMLPLREILESVGYELQWDAATKTTTIIDNNNYTELDARKAEIESMSGTLLTDKKPEYKPDSTKHVGNLTEEEKAFFAALNDVLRTYEAESSSYSDKYDTATNEEKKAVVDEFIGRVNSDIAKINCPESLKDFEKTLEEFHVDIGDLATNMADNLILLEGETDDVNNNIGLGLMMTYLVSMTTREAEFENTVNSFLTERNLSEEDAKLILSVVIDSESAVMDSEEE